MKRILGILGAILIGLCIATNGQSKENVLKDIKDIKDIKKETKETKKIKEIKKENNKDNNKDKIDNLRNGIRNLETRKQIIKIRADAQADLIDQDINEMKKQLSILEEVKKENK